MAANAYMKMVGQKQGKIAGSVTAPGREGAILVIAMEHDISEPRDPSSGLPTGKHQHNPLVLVKEVDAASPLLWNALSLNENLNDVVIDFYKLEGGAEVLYYSIRLINANVLAIKMEKLNTAYPENDLIRERERVALVYQKIQWSFAGGGATAEMAWTAPA